MRIPVFLNLGTAETQQWCQQGLQTCDLYNQHCDSNIQQLDHCGSTWLPKYLFTRTRWMQFHIDFTYIHNFANDHHPLLCFRARMSFLGKIFGGKGGQDKPVTTGEAIQKLRETEDMLMKKQVLKFIGGKVWNETSFPKDFLEKKIESEVATARKNAKTNKRAALQALKRKKRWGLVWGILPSQLTPNLGLQACRHTEVKKYCEA